MVNEIIMYCTPEHNCCTLGNCYATKNIEKMIEGTDIEFKHITSAEDPVIIKYGITHAPATMLLTDSVLITTILGKNIEIELAKYLDGIPWR
jgi:hypothetical protein